jgi:hypothetical protein
MSYGIIKFFNGYRTVIYFQNPNEDTEWNDILRSKGILPQKEKEVTEADIVNMLEATVEEKLSKSKEISVSGAKFIYKSGSEKLRAVPKVFLSDLDFGVWCAVSVCKIIMPISCL